MKKIFAILLASTALAVGAGIPAWSAMHGMEQTSIPSNDDGVLTLASDDSGVDRDHGRAMRGGDDDDRHGDDDDDGDEDEDDDDDYGGSASANPAPAGTVAPPANGLFGSGGVPKVKVN